MTTEIIRVPDIGMDSATCIEVSVKTGDTIEVDDTIVVLESDKASMDVPAPMAGKVVQVKISEGDSAAEGDELIYIETADSGSDDNSQDESEAKPAAKEEPKPTPAASKPAGATGGGVKPVKVPDIGMDSASVIEIAVSVGDTISEEDTLIVLESDKASMDVPSPDAGEVVAIKVNEGDSVSEGDVIIELKAAGDSSEEAPAQPANTESAQAAPGATSPKAPSALEEVKIPDIGMDSAKVIEVSVKPGDVIAEEDTIVVLESDKASMDVPSPAAGEVISVSVNEGDDVSEGTLVLTIKAEGSEPAAPAEAADQPSKSSSPAPAPATESSQAPVISNAYEDAPIRPSKNVHAGPAVRRLAREFGVDLAKVPGSGPRNRILKDDVAGWVKKRLQEPQQPAAGAGLPTVPDQDFSKFGEVEIVDMNRIQQITAVNMVRNTLVVPHVTQFDEADVTDTEAFRQSLKPDMEKRGVKISPLAFIVKACASALEEFPKFNVSLMADGKRYVQKHYINIGVAVDTPNGLIVPVIKDADKKSIWQIAEEIIDFAKRGRDGKVKPAEMQGGCFTVSSLGGLGGTAFTPIVNTPEVAILGVSKNSVKPHWNGSEFVPRTFTPLSLSYDHRAINGADAAKFTTYLSTVLADVRRLVL
ncbi:pyruvate dehydrogenase complex dihydrolipoyllysine-residue acetyltransferase [Reinekea blandensis]|uniref:Acetyltransferase component of pyruvate dehydrogenase complex n=1 Tax=Reinekea blandensis MED297 TaxID=314283 RepID=A4BGM4_9GAMM|nr:pyruvate dehydrogenase complex dihydrolipoyllysine-residue acetyltransferase [Reinekea blandensis]EAR08672.1 dihydrolipoamide acetyltransferase [Reinekea sp. MED297] [Reinekea blandensis MED297]